FEILPGHPGTGADQILDEDLLCGLRVAEFEARIGLGHRLIPPQLLLVDPLRPAELAHAKSALIYDLAAIDQRHACTRDSKFLHGAFDERFELSNTGSIQRMRLTPGEGFALVAFRMQALHDPRNWSAALLERRHGPIHD